MDNVDLQGTNGRTSNVQPRQANRSKMKLIGLSLKFKHQPRVKFIKILTFKESSLINLQSIKLFF